MPTPSKAPSSTDRRKYTQYSPPYRRSVNGGRPVIVYAKVRLRESDLLKLERGKVVQVLMEETRFGDLRVLWVELVKKPRVGGR